jgi:hypothetical protein
MSAERRDLPAVVGTAPPATTSAVSSSVVVPAMIAAAGDHAAKRFQDFFSVPIDNDNTAMAYYRAVCSFFAWLEQHGMIRELVDIEPLHVAAYIKTLKVSDPGNRAVKERAAANPTRKQNRACQSPRRIAGSGQARFPRGDTIFHAPQRFKCIGEIPTSIWTRRTNPLPLLSRKCGQRSAETHETRRQNHAPRTLPLAVPSNHY